MSVELIMGGMWAGKTRRLIELTDFAKENGEAVVLYKYSEDVRYGDQFMISSHDNLHRPAIPVKTLADTVIEPGTTIGIDEGQFISGLVEFAERAANAGCRVLITALSSDWKRESFPIIAELIPKCENILQLHAVCFNCKKEASFTKRITANTEQESIGGAEQYKAVCRRCHQTPRP